MFLADQTPPTLPPLRDLSVVPKTITSDATGLTTIADKILGFILEIAGVLAVAAFVVTGILYLLSFGNEQKMLQAKKNFIWATIGVVIISLMLGLIGAVRKLVEG